MKLFKTATLLLIFFTLFLGIIYPLTVTVIGQLLFPHQADGSLIIQNGEIRGSYLLGQSFTDVKYFWPRPSHTAGFAYNAAYSGGSNLGTSNPHLLALIQERLAHLRQAHSNHDTEVPIELLMGSGSGLDPHISINAAMYQVGRIAKARGISENTVHTIIETQKEYHYVNVLKLNLALDEAAHGKTAP